jgi:hypothetical protein
LNGGGLDVVQGLLITVDVLKEAIVVWEVDAIAIRQLVALGVSLHAGLQPDSQIGVWCLMKNLFQVFVEGEERY